MKRKLLRTLLVAASLLAGGNAWADNFVTAWSNDLSSTDGWTYSGNAPSSLNITTNNCLGTDNSYLNFMTANGRDRTNLYNLTNSQFASSDNYIFEFDLAIYGSNANNHLAHTDLYYKGSDNTNVALFSIDCKGYNSFTLSSGDIIEGFAIEATANNKSTRDNVGAANIWYHYTIASNSTDGTTLKVEKWNSGTKVVVKDATQIVNGVVHLTQLQITGGSYQQWSIDNMTLGISLEAYTTRATAATATYTAIKDGVMGTTVKTALDGAYNTLTTDYDTDAKIIANVAGYATAISALETANANAQASIEAFAVLNDLITNASSVTGYVAPSGAESTFTVNSDADVNALTASVRAAIITAGTANENTDITALIANSSFELGNTYGWTTVASDDTGARTVGEQGSTYYSSGADGAYLFNTWSKGTPITQTLGTLPAGQYTLTCKVSSNGATVYLKMNDLHNGGVVTTDGAVFVDNTYTFTLGSATEVTIGAVGGAGDGSYIEEGHWWYKADNFTLTYVGEDPLEQAKSALNDEITAATTVKDSYTSKVGTAPFLYPVATYNTLVAEINEATTVYNSGSTTVADYTTARSELETAKDNMSNSTINEPDATKYYRLYSSGTTLNLNLLESSSFNCKLTATPAAVKIVKVNQGYNIKTVYGDNLCHDKTSTWNWGANTGVEMRGERYTAALQDDGTVIFTSAYSNSIISTSNQTEGAILTKNATYNKWVVSDAVDVTDVNLSVNATAGWGTFIAPYDNLTPSTVKAYTVSYTENNVIFFTENTTGVLSANTPYILSTEEESNVSSDFVGIANNTEDTYTVNGLVGLLTDGTVPVNSYVLQYQAAVDGTAFYRVASAMSGTKNRCYLDLTGVPTSNPGASAPVRLSLFGGDDQATGIVTVENENDKFNGAIYNLAGQRVGNDYKGIVIRNGKKYLMK